MVQVYFTFQTTFKEGLFAVPYWWKAARDDCRIIQTARDFIASNKSRWEWKVFMRNVDVELSINLSLKLLKGVNCSV